MIFTMKSMVKYSLTFVMLIAVFLLFALASYILPNHIIQNNIRESVSKGDIVTDYPRAIVNKEMCRMDNCTDALILNQTYCLHQEPLLRAVMLVPSIGGETRDVAALKEAVIGNTEPVQHYARYWHGSTFLMRFLTATIGRYANIQLFLYYSATLLLFILLVILIRHGKTKLALSLFGSFILLKGYLLLFSIQFWPVLMLSLIASILVLSSRTSKNAGFILFIIGSLTAYFDLLTTPLLTLGIPLLIIISRSEDINIGISIKEIIKICLLWICGYAATWVTKWGLATVFTGMNVFADAIHTGIYRIGGEVPQMGHFNVIDTLLANIRKNSLLPLMLIFLVLLTLMCLSFNKKNIKEAFLYFLVSLTPYLWYVVLSNHSYIHCWFTYRTQIISIAALFMVCLTLTDWPRLRSKVIQHHKS